MALSFIAVQEAYRVFNKLGVKNIPSWPIDVAGFNNEQLANLEPDTVYGYCKKSDDGWENLFFITAYKDNEYRYRFRRLAITVPNSNLEGRYPYNEKYEVFGWF